MQEMKDSGSFMRREDDFPVLVVSQDYELFFQLGGSLEKCLFEPCDLLTAFADEHGIRITFFVDAGMLCRMKELASTNPSLSQDLARVRHHLEGLARQGHEIGLHIHPHWEDTRWNDNAWDFSGTRYQLRQFSTSDVSDIVGRYTNVLNELCDGSVKTYRAGGFCIEPFSQIREALVQHGIMIDSSVVPGAVLKDESKGFDFSRAPDSGWWYFDESPTEPCKDGTFIEVPVTPNVLPLFHYWGRLIDRALGRQAKSALGDGLSKAIGKREVIRRLFGGGRVCEISTDTAKAGQLVMPRTIREQRKIWHVMGHPKLLGWPSLEQLAKFIDRQDIKRFETVFGLASSIGNSEFAEH